MVTQSIANGYNVKDSRGQPFLMSILLGPQEDLAKFLKIAHPNPLTTDRQGQNGFDALNMLIKQSEDTRITLGPSEATIKSMDKHVNYLKTAQKILTDYLYTWSRDVGGYFQSRVLPTDLLKIIGNDIAG